MVQEKYHHDDLKSELIEKGLKLLDAEGYENFSLRKLAKACNVSHAAPYRHFRNKDQLILAISLEATSKFSQCLQEAVDHYPDDPLSQLNEMGYSYIKFFAENPELLRLLFLSDINKRIPSISNNPNDKYFLAVKEKSPHPFDILYETVKRCKEARPNNMNNNMDLDALVLYCWGLVHGLAILITRKDFPYQGDYLELARKIVWETNSPD